MVLAFSHSHPAGVRSTRLLTYSFYICAGQVSRSTGQEKGRNLVIAAKARIHFSDYSRLAVHGALMYKKTIPLTSCLRRNDILHSNELSISFPPSRNPKNFFLDSLSPSAASFRSATERADEDVSRPPRVWTPFVRTPNSSCLSRVSVDLLKKQAPTPAHMMIALAFSSCRDIQRISIVERRFIYS